MSKFKFLIAQIPARPSTAQVHAGFPISSADIGAKIANKRHTVPQQANTIPVTRVGVTYATVT